MAILALTDKAVVDLGGAKARLDSEQAQGIPVNDMFFDPRTFTDLGLVHYNGVEFYASLYQPKVEDEDNSH